MPILHLDSLINSTFQLATSIMNYGGKAVRGGQLFGEETKIAMTKKYFKGLQGVENIYTQHKPYMIDILQVKSVICRTARIFSSIFSVAKH